jgi:hypothetical protein
MLECRNCKNKRNFNKIKNEYFDYCSIECHKKNTPICSKCDNKAEYDKINEKYFKFCSRHMNNESYEYLVCNNCGELRCCNNGILIYNNCSCKKKIIIMKPYYPQFPVVFKKKKVLYY